MSLDTDPVPTETIVETHVPETPDDPDADDQWVAELDARIREVATGGTYTEPSPGAFLERAYSLTMTTLTETYDRDDETVCEHVDSWLSALETSAQAVAADGPHDRDATDFLVHVYVSTLLRISEGESPASVTEWYDELLGRALRALDSDALVRFYLTYVRLLRSSDRHPRDWLPWLVEDVIARSADGDGSIRGADAKRADLVAAVTAEVVLFVHGGVQAGSDLARDHFDAVVETVSGIDGSDPEGFDAVRSGVVDRLREDHGADEAASEWQRSFE